MVDIQQDFWEFLFRQPWQEWGVSWVCLCAGALSHWMKQAIRKQASWNLWKYTLEYPGHTATMFATLVAAEFGLMTSGASSAFSTWPTFMYAAWSAGWIANSAINRAKPAKISSSPTNP